MASIWVPSGYESVQVIDTEETEITERIGHRDTEIEIYRESPCLGVSVADLLSARSCWAL